MQGFVGMIAVAVAVVVEPLSGRAHSPPTLR
jgi:hypothetical protein